MTKKSLMTNNLATANSPKASDPMTCWNKLAKQWKDIFLYELAITLEEFQQQPQEYLDRLTQLTELDVQENRIRSILALRNLIQLESLCLDDNKIKNISALRNLTKLKYLYIRTNKIQDISPLENLTQLIYLVLFERYFSSRAFNSVNIAGAWH
ncbi:hypothetical protein B0186_08285 [Canicola haemoglobinophilus]|uniref:Internalin-A n=1 Tax=Canicola haemoglobinophilus TaxID=733 RepID=A0A1V4AZW5_9PAST|nr:leucine-rich repeat domain-containing protein [Canicola haemoglobinophilus]OOR99077.1 hypothetical protein B0186_08285 [Canicola haemoglobinophilus]STO60244.1 Internalin-A precursor [Canicola haemoglobinophilus]